MESSLQKPTSLLLALGSLLFIIAAFLPVSRVFAEPDPDKKLSIIMDLRTMWTTGQVLFGLGSLVTVVALGWQSWGLRTVNGAGWSHLGVILLFIGMTLWCWHVWERAFDPKAFVSGTNTPYLFWLYSILTQIGLVLLGITVLRSDQANWVGWMFIIGAATFLILMIIFKDMPPFVYYVLTLVAAVVFYLGAESTYAAGI
jgi:hypothetical protein